MLTGAVGLLLALFPDSGWGYLHGSSAHLGRRGGLHDLRGPAFGFLGVGLALYFAPRGRGAWDGLLLRRSYVFSLPLGAAVALNHFALGLNGIYLAAALGMVIYGSLSAASLALGAWRPRDGKNS